MNPEKVATPSAEPERVTRQRIWWLSRYAPWLLAFFLPLFLLGGVFALFRVFPFGDQQILVTDFWQQYYPFLCDFWHKLREGHSLLWSWTAGMGVNYLATISYYLASPCNLLLVLFPLSWLREVLTLLLLIKIGCAGLFSSLYLSTVHQGRRRDTLLFSSGYALSAFTLGYYWNIIWFDSFALLPLVMLGLHLLLKKEKALLYTISLFLAVFSNFYIGFMICLYVALSFLRYWWEERWRPVQAIRQIWRMILHSGIACCLTAVLTIPAWFALLRTYQAAVNFPSPQKMLTDFGSILGNLIPFIPPVAIGGDLPNIYCGLLTALLAGVFLVTDRISWRKRLGWGTLLAFLFFSLNHNVTNFIWHALHTPNQLPFRFSFLVSFTLMTMAYQVYLKLPRWRRREFAALVVTIGILLLASFRGPQENLFVLITLGLATLYFAFTVLGRFLHKGVRRRMQLALLVVVILELAFSTVAGVNTVRTTSHSSYLWRYNEVQQLLAQRDKTASAFYRSDFTRWYSVNDPTLYGYQGISIFSSTLGAHTSLFLEGLGLPSWPLGNRYYYAETSPLSNAFLNLRYLLNRDTVFADGGINWQQISEVNGTTLWENERYLPLGFVVSPALANYSRGSDPFTNQNSLFTLASGLPGDLFTLLPPESEAHRNYSATLREDGLYRYERLDGEGGVLEWDYFAPSDGLLYAYLSGCDDLTIIRTDNSRTWETKRPFIICLGHFVAEERVSLSMELTSTRGNINLQVCTFDQLLFDEAYKKIATETLELTQIRDTQLSGIVSSGGGLLYTSIPYEEGWTATVDGNPTPIEVIDGCMIAIPLLPGTHTVSFSFWNEGLTLGLSVSLTALILLILLTLPRRLMIREPASEVAS